MSLSFIGVIFLLMLTVPNIIWTRNQPEGYSPEGENRALLICERTGQAAVTVITLFFAGIRFDGFSPWSLWLAAAFGLMLAYECWWIRYFRSEKQIADFYSSFMGVPVVGATLPVAAFLLLALYARSLWLAPAVILLGIGHIGIHLQHLRKIKKPIDIDVA